MIDLDDLVVAYRKAKVDLFLATDQRLLDLANYEQNLEANLRDLQKRVNGKSRSWLRDVAFTGSFTLTPKSVDRPDASASRWSSPEMDWRHETIGAKPRSQFRVMAKCSIDLHVFSTLWLLQVGTYLDKRLGSSAYGSRLRKGPMGGANILGLGSFSHYYTPYRSWRDRGLAEISNALAADSPVVALTADATSFYHGLEPDFLLQPAFIRRLLGASLDIEQRRLNDLFVRSLKAWSGQFAELGWPAQGLPVGLPASAVVANLALAELDAIAARVNPRYYGRYVDDILLVLSDDGSLRTQDDVWSRLVDQSEGSLRAINSQGPDGVTRRSIRFEPRYLVNSVVTFENAKNKSFHLNGSSGQAMIDSIRTAIDGRTSEWRTLPWIPPEPETIRVQLATATRADGSDATTLRDTDRVSIRRLTLSLRLREFETYERSLDYESWEDERFAFVRAFSDYVLTAPAIFELGAFLPRVVKLAAACRDLRALSLVFTALSRIPTLIAETCINTVAHYSPAEEDPRTIEAWMTHLATSAVEWLTAGWHGPISSAELQDLLAPLRRLDPNVAFPGVRQLQRDHAQLVARDLAHRPYRWAALAIPATAVLEEARSALPIGPGIRLHPAIKLGLDDLVEALPLDVSRRAFQGLRGSEVAGLAFATRPPSPLELYLAVRGSEDRYGVPSRSVIRRILHAIRGFPLDLELPRVQKAAKGTATTVFVPLSSADPKRRIAMTMFQTSVKDALKAAEGTPNHTASRFLQLSAGLDRLQHQTEGADYLLLPELALPPHWFTHFALQFRRRKGPNLIAGIEHQPNGPTTVTNQVWAALAFDGVGFPMFVHRQDKIRPARPEARLLHSAKKTLNPSMLWPGAQPPVIAHGQMRFGLLVCSELTNISYRNHFRGQIDILFVPEWNKDLGTFSTLVESAALDVHAYIAQANIRGYGDSRIRAPGKEDWERDLVRLRGGDLDYIVSGTIDYEKLRGFQGIPFDPSEPEACCHPLPFKPTPDGFELAPVRSPISVSARPPCNCLDNCPCKLVASARTNPLAASPPEGDPSR